MLSLGIPMLYRPAPRALNPPTTTAPSNAPTIHATTGPAAKIGPSPGIIKNAEPNRSPQKPPQKAPFFPRPMQVGGITETVTVSAEAAILQTETTQIGSVISADAIANIPQISRNPTA